LLIVVFIEMLYIIHLNMSTTNNIIWCLYMKIETNPFDGEKQWWDAFGVEKKRLINNKKKIQNNNKIN